MKKSLTILLTTFICLLNFSIQAKTLHGIIVADTIHDITAVTETDVIKWQDELKLMAKYSEMDLNQQVFCGQDFNQNKVADYVTDCAIQPDDVVIFYYSGHGFRNMKKKTPWPFMNFDLSENGMDVQWIADKIREKKPQFSLIITDCCNTYAETGMFGNHAKEIEVTLKTANPYYPGYKELFSNSKGCIIISSCSPGQFSYGSIYGGLYTQCFFNHLKHELSNPVPSWKGVIQRTYQSVKRIQRPLSQVYR